MMMNAILIQSAGFLWQIVCANLLRYLQVKKQLLAWFEKLINIVLSLGKHQWSDKFEVPVHEIFVKRLDLEMCLFWRWSALRRLLSYYFLHILYFNRDVCPTSAPCCGWQVDRSSRQRGCFVGRLVRPRWDNRWPCRRGSVGRYQGR